MQIKQFITITITTTTTTAKQTIQRKQTILKKLNPDTASQIFYSMIFQS